MIKEYKHQFLGIDSDTNKELYPPNKYPYAFCLDPRINEENNATGVLSPVRGNTKAFRILYNEASSGDNIFVNILSPDEKKIALKFGDSINKKRFPIVASSNFIYKGCIQCSNYTILFYESDKVSILVKAIEDDYKIVFIENSSEVSFMDGIQGVFNKENASLEKIYWTNGVELFHLNVANAKLKENFIDTIRFKGVRDNIIINTVVNKGSSSFSTCKVQYAVSFYKNHSTETIPIVSAAKSTVDAAHHTKVTIKNIDFSYDFFRLYRILFTSNYQPPTVSIVSEQIIDESEDNIIIEDTGGSVSDISFAEFALKGLSNYSATTIESKDSRLLLGGIKDTSFDIEFDARAFSYDSNNVCKLTNANSSKLKVFDASENINALLPTNSDAVSLDPNKFIYGKTIATYGAEGVNVILTATTSGNNKVTLIPNENYRFGLVLLDKYGNQSQPKWICDYKVPVIKGKDAEQITDIECRLTSTAQSYLTNKGVEGYALVRAKCYGPDKTVRAQGVMQPTVVQDVYDDDSVYYKLDEFARTPWPLTRGLDETRFTKGTAEGVIEPTLSGKNIFQSTPHPNRVKDGVTYHVYPEIEGNSSKHINTFIDDTVCTFTSPQITNSKDFVVPKEAAVSLYRAILPGASESTGSAGIQTVSRVFRDNKLHTLRGIGLASMARNDGAQMLDTAMLQTSYETSGTDEWNFMHNSMQSYYGDSWYGTNKNVVHAESIHKTIDSEEEISLKNQTSSRVFVNSLVYIKIKDTGTHGQNVNSIESRGTDSLVMILNPGLSYFKTDKYDANRKQGLPIADLVVENTAQYGGGSYEAKRNTEYIQCSEIRPIGSIVANNVIVGEVVDTDFLRIGLTDQTLYKTTNGVMAYSNIVSCPLLWHYDEPDFYDPNRKQLTYSKKYSYKVSEIKPTNTPYIAADATPLVIRGNPATFDKVEDFKTTIMPSALKQNNESIDSWTNIMVNEGIKLDGKYGPINSIVANGKELYSFQDNGVAKVAVNPRVQISTTDNEALILGSGGVLYDYVYLSTSYGALDNKSTHQTDAGVFFLDKTKLRAGIAGSSGLIDLTLQTSTVNLFKDKFDSAVIYGCYYDKLVNKIYICSDKATIVYDIIMKQFTHLLPATYTNIFNNGDKLYSIDDSNAVWLEHSGVKSNIHSLDNLQEIKLLATNGNADCVFNNIKLDTNKVPTYDFLNSIQCENSWGESDVTKLVSGKNFNKKYGYMNITIPRDKDNKLKRIRGGNATTTLLFDAPSTLKILGMSTMINQLK